MVQHKIDGYMLPHPVHFCIIIQILELQVWTIIVLLVMHRVICLYYKIIYLVTPKNVKCPIIKKYFMDIIEQHLVI